MTDVLLEKSVRIVAAAWKGSPYYADAEKWIHVFWGEGTIFRRLFAQLDLTKVIELACGHGRHSEQIVDRAGLLTMMDVHPENIEATKARVEGKQNCHFIVNNGYDFQPVAENTTTAIFCYDAMVHFSPDLVGSYLKDTNRVLKSGGRALYHHSNYDAPIGMPYGRNPHARNHMTYNLFKRFATDAGLNIVDSTPIAWANTQNLDRVSLLAKD
jgi:ubiquinone/menaquinone biosynthesis C-methylase UbiE